VDDILNEEEVKWLYKALRKIDFFATISVEDIYRFTSRFFKQTFPVDKYIIRQGDIGNALYVIRSGSCRIYVKRSFFKRTDVAVLKSGDFFGEMSLILNEPTSAFVLTTEPTELFIFMKSDFEELVSKNQSLLSEIRHVAKKRKMEDSQS